LAVEHILGCPHCNSLFSCKVWQRYNDEKSADDT